MPLNFQPQLRSSFDPIHRVSIPQPRILPATLPEGQEGTEYQYAFIRDGKMIGGLGFFGTDVEVEIAGRKEWVFTLDLGHDWLISSMVEFKQVLGDADDDLTFVRGLANGLVMAYAGRTDNEDNLRYVAVTTSAALAAAGVAIPAETEISADGLIVLAQVVVPAHAG